MALLFKYPQFISVVFVMLAFKSIVKALQKMYYYFTSEPLTETGNLPSYNPIQQIDVKVDF